MSKWPDILLKTWADGGQARRIGAEQETTNMLWPGLAQKRQASFLRTLAALACQAFVPCVGSFGVDANIMPEARWLITCLVA